MNFFRYAAKRLIMSILSACLAVYAFFRQRPLQKSEIKNIGILFLPVLGIGDLVMLSPFIEAVAALFPHAKITLITWVPSCISFSRVSIVRHTDVSWKTHEFDCIISPSLNVRHIPYIWRARYWVGYFSKTRVQTNSSLPSYIYDMRHDHYSTRGVRLIQALDPVYGKTIEDMSQSKTIVYPAPHVQEPTLYRKTGIDQVPYMVVGIFSKWEDRQWSLQNFATIIAEVYERKQVQRIVLIGDASEHNMRAAERFIALCGLPTTAIVNATGACTLSETNFLISRCHVYIGLDSGPAHMAYLLSPRSVVLFITVPPELRLPLTTTSRKIIPVYLDPAPTQPLYTGYGPVSTSVVKKNMHTITLSRVRDAVNSILT